MWRNITKHPGKRLKCYGRVRYGQRRMQAMRQRGTWSVARGWQSSSAKWRKPCDLAVCFSQWMKCWLGPASPLLRGHLSVDDFLCASEADADNYEGHVGDSEMAFGAFPQAELNGTVLAKVEDAAPTEFQSRVAASVSLLNTSEI